jgi:pimeloyl-ACP methyl ester carboxylesterase
MDGTRALFSDFVKALPGPVVATIVPYPTEWPLTYLELEELVQRATRNSEPFILVAESYSTPLAIKFAAAQPANLAGLVLCAGFASSPIRGLRRALGFLLAPVLFRFPLPDFAVRFWLVGADVPNSLLATGRDSISSVQPSVLAARLRDVLRCDARADLSRIGVPILCIRAKSDRLVGTSCLEEIRRIKPAGKVEVVDGPHLILQRQPRIAAKVVAEFARSCCPDWIG